MSNQKKRQQARLQEAEFEKMVTKRDQEIMNVLYNEISERRIPKDKNRMAYFYSGAKWADENPADATVRRYFSLGFITGFLLCSIGWLITLIFG